MEKFSILRLTTLAVIAATASSYLQILHPKDLKSKLKNDGVILSSLGNFGHVIYGSTVVSLKM